jgi:eukaryotic-like serine/threonine-protein kinase
MRRLTPSIVARPPLAFCDTEVGRIDRAEVLQKLGDHDFAWQSDCSSTIVPPASATEEDLLQKLPVVISGTNLPRQHVHLELLGCEIGRGAMGRVEVAQQVALQREVAVKSPIDKEKGSRGLVQLLREGRVTGWLAHPNVVPVYMLGKDDAENPLLVMKRISGAVWSSFIADPSLVMKTGHQGDLLDWHLQVLIQVCNAIHYSHSKGIIHRDLKPDNIMIGEFGEIYVLDWGLAVGLEFDNDLGLPHVGSLRALAGTPGFMPPELVRVDNDAMGVRSDVYLLGGILHAIITGGRARHEAATILETLTVALKSEPFHYDESAPEELAAICNRATAAEPEDRFDSADVFRRALVDFVRHRHSTGLCREAQARLIRLFDEMAVVQGATGDQSDRLYRLYGESRFGFYQSLREWEANEVARTGLQDLLEAMLGYEIEQGDLRAATKLLAELPSPNQHLAERTRALRDEIAARSLRFEQLQELARKNDSSVGRKERAMMVIAMGVIWGGFYGVLGWLTRHGVYRFGHGTYLVINGSFGCFLVFATMRWRTVLTATTVNKNFLWSLWTAFGVASLWWTFAWRWGLELARAMAVNILLYAAITWMAAAAVDRRIRWAALAYALGAIYLSVDARFPWEVLAVSTAAAMFSMGLAWLRTAEEKTLASAPPGSLPS